MSTMERKPILKLSKGDYKFDSVFGTVKVEKKEDERYGSKVTIENPNNLKNFIRRELGVTRSIAKQNRYIDGLSNPEKYLVDRTYDEAYYCDQSAEEYGRVYQDLLERGYSDEDCEKKALKAAKDYFEMKKKSLDQDYPQDITGKLVKKLTKN